MDKADGCRWIWVRPKAYGRVFGGAWKVLGRFTNIEKYHHLACAHCKKILGLNKGRPVVAHRCLGKYLEICEFHYFSKISLFHIPKWG